MARLTISRLFHNLTLHTLDAACNLRVTPKSPQCDKIKEIAPASLTSVLLELWKIWALIIVIVKNLLCYSIRAVNGADIDYGMSTTRPPDTSRMYLARLARIIECSPVTGFENVVRWFKWLKNMKATDYNRKIHTERERQTETKTWKCQLPSQVTRCHPTQL